MQTITPCLWFDTQADEAATFYASLFKNSSVGDRTHYDAASAKVSGQKEGSVLTVGFRLCGMEFVALNGGPQFQFTPAISFMVSCETAEEIDALWAALARDAKQVLMAYGEYPWSSKYGWLVDTYGVSWQLMLGGKPQSIATALLFTGDQYGKAEEAMTFWTSLFPDAGIDAMQRRAASAGGEKEGTVEYAAFTLCGQPFNAMESQGHAFTFSLATSFTVNCETQEEVDTYWQALSAVPQAEQCGWLQDKYGVSWQIVPTVMQKMLTDPDPAKAQRAMGAMLQMKKLDIAALRKAYEG